MFGYGRVEESDPKVADRNYCLWRFMIDQAYQGQGIGKEERSISLEYLKTMPQGQVAYCWLSYEPENVRAKALYTSMGFQENGDVCESEIVAVLKL